MYGAVTVGTATNWPGGGYDPELHIAFMPAGNIAGVRTLVAPPPGFSDIKYVAGLEGQPFREVLGPGDCCAADAPRTAERAREARGSAGAREAAGCASSRKPPKRAREARATPPPAPAPEPPSAANAAAGPGAGLNVQGLPMIKPPYGLLAAVNLDRGELMWQTPHGDTPDNVRNHAALRGLDIPKTGQAGTSGVGLLVTKTLVVMGDPQLTTTSQHPRGAMLRAYDKTTGKEVGAVWMAAPQSGSPMTYSVDGRQFIVVAIGGGPYSGEYLAFSLPAS